LNFNYDGKKYLEKEVRMKVRDLYHREVSVIGKEDSLLEAGKRMREHHVGSLVVVEEQGDRLMPVGIITDRDILIQVLTEGVPLEKISVQDIMAENPTLAGEEDSISETIQRMRRKGIRRIPVVDSRQNLTGILTLDDLLEVLAEEIRGLSEISGRGREWEALKRP
jgi:predicted transcriptional regulator